MEFDRRTLLKGAGLGLASVFISSEAKADHETIKDITLEQSLNQAKRFDRLKDKLPESYAYNLHTMEDVDNWINETVPFFEYEGITDPDQDIGEYGGLVYPDNVHFEYYEDGLRHNHVLGTTQIFSNEITLNERYSNPISPFYERGDSVTTLIHELAHAQGIKFDGTLVNSESSAQLAMLEVASAMYFKGNDLLLDNLLDDLRYMHYAAAKYIGLRDGREQEVLEARNDIFSSKYDQAKLDKSDRYWKDNPDRLKQILHDYSFTPITEIHKAMQSGKDEIEGVYLPKNWLDNFRNAPAYYPDNNGQWKEPDKVRTDPLVIDDLAYFIRNADILINEIT